MHDLATFARVLVGIEFQTNWPRHVDEFQLNSLRKAGMIDYSAGADHLSLKHRVTQKGKIFVLIFEEALNATGKMAHSLNRILSGMTEPVVVTGKTLEI